MQFLPFNNKTLPQTLRVHLTCKCNSSTLVAFSTDTDTITRSDRTQLASITITGTTIIPREIHMNALVACNRRNAFHS